MMFEIVLSDSYRGAYMHTCIIHKEYKLPLIVILNFIFFLSLNI